MTEKSELHPDLKGLVLEAFRIAACQGKPEWHRMRGTVLKNRLLDLTGRTFDEADYGADRFGALVEQLEELLAVDHSAKPFLVELREPHRSLIAPLEGMSEPSRSESDSGGSLARDRRLQRRRRVGVGPDAVQGRPCGRSRSSEWCVSPPDPRPVCPARLAGRVCRTALGGVGRPDSTRAERLGEQRPRDCSAPQAAARIVEHLDARSGP